MLIELALCTVVMPVWKGYRPKFVLFARRRLLRFDVRGVVDVFCTVIRLPTLPVGRSFPQKIRSAFAVY